MLKPKPIIRPHIDYKALWFIAYSLKKMFMVFFTCCFQSAYTFVLMMDKMDSPPPPRSVSVFLQPKKRAPQTHINTLIYHHSTVSVHHGGKTATVPLKAAYTLQQIPIQFQSHSKERCLVVVLFIHFIYVFSPFWSPGWPHHDLSKCVDSSLPSHELEQSLHILLQTDGVVCHCSDNSNNDCSLSLSKVFFSLPLS